MRGNQVAFSDRRREIRYGELERRTARIAGHLAGHGDGGAGDNPAPVRYRSSGEQKGVPFISIPSARYFAHWAIGHNRTNCDSSV
jgi:hypothetical protein